MGYSDSCDSDGRGTMSRLHTGRYVARMGGAAGGLTTGGRGAAVAAHFGVGGVGDGVVVGPLALDYVFELPGEKPWYLVAGLLEWGEDSYSWRTVIWYPSYFKGIPVWLVTAPYSGLTGAGVALEQAFA